MIEWYRRDDWWRRYCKDHDKAMMMLPDRRVRSLPWCPGCLSSWVPDQEALEHAIEIGAFPAELAEIAREEARVRAVRAWSGGAF
jgi:hypothetical protein